MKTRHGFVSNSSSSSFLVKLPEEYGTRDSRHYATKEDVKQLLDFGFRPTKVHCASRLEAGVSNPSCLHEAAAGYFYQVTCNEDEIASWLMKNNIPFEAACHYGHYHLFFRRDDEEYLFVPNVGCSLETYGPYPKKESWEEVHLLQYPDYNKYKHNVAEYLDEIGELHED